MASISCSSMKQSKYFRNATSASDENANMPIVNDFKEFVLEMQKTISSLRNQVRCYTEYFLILDLIYNVLLTSLVLCF